VLCVHEAYSDWEGALRLICSRWLLVVFVVLFVCVTLSGLMGITFDSDACKQLRSCWFLLLEGDDTLAKDQLSDLLKLRFVHKVRGFMSCLVFARTTV